VTRDEEELRRALEARSGAPAPEFQARLTAALAAGPPASRLVPVMALVAATILTLATVGTLVWAGSAVRGVRHGGITSSARTVTPSPMPTVSIGQPVAGVLTPPPGPTPMPDTVTLSAPSRDVVWALVADMYLYSSTDGGNTWQQRPLPPDPPGSPFSDVSFVDDQNGWLLRGGPGATQCSFGGATIWHTFDAGTTWQRVVYVDYQHEIAQSIGFAQCKENLSFIDVTHGFVDGWDDNGRPTIYRTADGGVTWSARTLADPPGFTTYGSGDALRAGRVKSFGPTLLVQAYGMQPNGFHGYVFQSSDGGSTWTYLADLSRPLDVTFVTATRWIEIVGHMESTDSGRTWHPFTSDYHSQAAGAAPQVVFADPLIGYATVRSDIQRTIDGGAHWTHIRTPGM